MVVLLHVLLMNAVFVEIVEAEGVVRRKRCGGGDVKDVAAIGVV
jgi:hypothetical protein